MSIYTVIREAGPGWAEGGIFDQPRTDEHATFMNALAGERFLLYAGPLAGTEAGRVRVLLIFDAENEAEIARRLADDPWAVANQLVTMSIEPWQILVGAEELPRRNRLAAQRH